MLSSLSRWFYSEPPILKAHNYTDIILRLPMGKRIKDIKWLSVWCRRFTVFIMHFFSNILVLFLFVIILWLVVLLYFIIFCLFVQTFLLWFCYCSCRIAPTPFKLWLELLFEFVFPVLFCIVSYGTTCEVCFCYFVCGG